MVDKMKIVSEFIEPNIHSEIISFQVIERSVKIMSTGKNYATYYIRLEYKNGSVRWMSTKFLKDQIEEMQLEKTLKNNLMEF